MRTAISAGVGTALGSLDASDSKFLSGAIKLGTSAAGKAAEYATYAAYSLAEGGTLLDAYDNMGGLTINVANLGAILDLAGSVIGRENSGGKSIFKDGKVLENLSGIGLLEVNFGSDGVSTAIGMGGIDVGGALYEQVKRGIDYAGLKSYMKEEQDFRKADMAWETYVYGDFTQENTAMRITNGKDYLDFTDKDFGVDADGRIKLGETVSGGRDGKGRTITVTDIGDMGKNDYGEYQIGSDGITISKAFLGGGKEGSAKLATAMAHEGVHALKGIRIEGIAHLQGNSTYNTINAIFGLQGDAVFSAKMVNAIRDTKSWVANTGNVDKWEVRIDGSYFDDGNDGVISFEDGRAAINTVNKGKQGSLEEYLGLESGEGYSLLMREAGFVYDNETRTWSGGNTISADAIKNLIAEGIISADVIGIAESETAAPSVTETAGAETKQTLTQKAKAVASDVWDKFKAFVAPVTVPVGNFMAGLFNKPASVPEVKTVPEVKEEKKAQEESKDTTAFTSKPVASGRLSSDYGKRDDVDVNKVGDFHSGVDYSVPKGTSVMATASGEVVEAVTNKYYGKFVSIKHDNGFTSYSMHLDTLTVKQGDKITGGTVIGTSGNTGEFASGQYHLHFSLYPSNIAPKLEADKKWNVRQSVNPMNHLPK